MRSTWSEPYLWLHLAGLAAVPLLLELCLLGLKAVDSPLALIPVALVGIGPIVWMQWNQPFSIFSLTPLVLQPNRMTETQRRILGQFKAPVGRVITVVVAVLALVLLWQLQQWLPSVNRTVDLPAGRLGGLVLACGAFLLSHLFLQVPASVVPVLLTPDQQLAPPHPVSQIPRDFTLVGLGVKQILPTPPAPPVSTPPVSTPPVSTPPAPTPPAPTAPSAQPTDLLQEEKRAAVAEPELSDLIQAELVDPATAPAAQSAPERIQAELITTESDQPDEPDLSSDLAEAEQTNFETALPIAPAGVESVESAADPVEAVPLNAVPIDAAPDAAPDVLPGITPDAAPATPASSVAEPAVPATESLSAGNLPAESLSADNFPIDSLADEPVDSSVGNPTDSPTDSLTGSLIDSPIDSPTNSPIDSSVASSVDEAVASPVEPTVEADLIQAAPSSDAVPVEPEPAPAELNSEPAAPEIAAAELITAALLNSSDFDGNSTNGSRSGLASSEGAAPIARVFPPQEPPAPEPPAVADRPWPNVRDTTVTIGPLLTNPFDEPAAQLDAAAFEVPAEPEASDAKPSSPPPQPQVSDTIIRIDPTTESTDP